MFPSARLFYKCISPTDSSLLSNLVLSPGRFHIVSMARKRQRILGLLFFANIGRIGLLLLQGESVHTSLDGKARAPANHLSISPYVLSLFFTVCVPFVCI